MAAAVQIHDVIDKNEHFHLQRTPCTNVWTGAKGSNRITFCKRIIDIGLPAEDRKHDSIKNCCVITQILVNQPQYTYRDTENTPEFNVILQWSRSYDRSC